MKYRFSDLADIPKLQELMGSLYWLTDIAIGIIDVDGSFLFCAGWRGACNTGKSKSCDCLDYISTHLDPVSYTFKQCPTGMLHYACPVVVEGEHDLRRRRLAGRVAMERAHGKDLVALGNSLERFIALDGVSSAEAPGVFDISDSSRECAGGQQTRMA